MIISMNMMMIFNGFACCHVAVVTRHKHRQLMHMMCFQCLCVCYRRRRNATVGTTARRHHNCYCLREMIAVAIPFVPSSTLPFSTTSPRPPINGPRPYPQGGASAGVCVGVRAARCCFSSADCHPAVMAASAALASMLQR